MLEKLRSIPVNPRLVAAYAAALAALALPAQALGSSASIYGDYTRDGSIDGCSYSGSQLSSAVGSIPTDVAQYDPGFKDALNKALGDSCGGGGTAGSGPDQGHSADGSPAPDSLLASTEALDPAGSTDLSADSGFPTALLVLAAMVAVILLGTGAVAYARRRGDASSPDSGGTLSDYYWALRDLFGRGL